VPVEDGLREKCGAREVSLGKKGVEQEQKHSIFLHHARALIRVEDLVLELLNLNVGSISSILFSLY